MKSNAKKIIILIILGMSFVFLPNIKLDFKVEQTTFNNLKSSSGYPGKMIDALMTYNTTYSGNWTWAVNQPWCYGQGTWQEPYIIENVTVDCGGTGSGIIINNSKNDHFIIRNCTVYNSGSEWSDAGIKLENTQNGTISGNTANNNFVGIYLLYDCDNNTISGNTANNNNWGIIFTAMHAGTCDNNTLSGNTASNNDYDGISLSFSKDNIISGNTANENNEVGISLYSECNDNKFSGNVVSDTLIGIYLVDFCDNNTISGNLVSDTLIGIYLELNCDNNTIESNTINTNDLGVRLDQSDYNNISDNILTDNGWCIYEFECIGNIIENNYCSNSTLQLPIYQWYCHRCRRT